MKKTFKIGEYCVNGELTAQVNKAGTYVTLICGKFQGEYDLYEWDAMRGISDWLNDKTTHYYADLIMKWIDSAVQKCKDSNNITR